MLQNRTCGAEKGPKGRLLRQYVPLNTKECVQKINNLTLSTGPLEEGAYTKGESLGNCFVKVPVYGYLRTPFNSTVAVTYKPHAACFRSSSGNFHTFSYARTPDLIEDWKGELEYGNVMNKYFYLYETHPLNDQFSQKRNRVEQPSVPHPKPVMCAWTLTPTVPKDFVVSESVSVNTLLILRKPLVSWCEPHNLPEKHHALEIPQSHIKRESGHTYLIASAKEALFDKSKESIHNLTGVAYFNTGSKPFAYVYAPDFQPGWKSYEDDVQDEEQFLLFSTKKLEEQHVRNFVQALQEKSIKNEPTFSEKKEREEALKRLTEERKRKREGRLKSDRTAPPAKKCRQMSSTERPQRHSNDEAPRGAKKKSKAADKTTQRKG